jgi:hypothetical protein
MPTISRNRWAANGFQIIWKEKNDGLPEAIRKNFRKNLTVMLRVLRSGADGEVRIVITPTKKNGAQEFQTGWHFTPDVWWESEIEHYLDDLVQKFSSQGLHALSSAELVPCASSGLF